MNIVTKPVHVKNDMIPINEIFESIQGEGPFMGRRALFIRFAGCNLASVCPSCDTDISTREIVSIDYLMKVIVNFANRGGKLIVFTGGEPSLYRDVVDEIVREFKFVYPYDVVFQVETNGIIKMGLDFILLGGVVVVSPKKFMYDKVLENYAGKSYAHFKVVIGADDDPAFWSFEEGETFIKDLIERGHDRNNIWLMPFGANDDILNENRKRVWDLAVKLGVNYSDRLHVLVWKKSMRGV